jgi:hypothetical protein
MAQALKKTEVSKSELDNSLSAANTQQAQTKKTPEASVLNFDKTKSFSRFLEASCDCC